MNLGWVDVILNLLQMKEKYTRSLFSRFYCGVLLGFCRQKKMENLDKKLDQTLRLYNSFVVTQVKLNMTSIHACTLLEWKTLMWVQCIRVSGHAQTWLMCVCSVCVFCLCCRMSPNSQKCVHAMCILIPQGERAGDISTWLSESRDKLMERQYGAGDVERNVCNLHNWTRDKMRWSCEVQSHVSTVISQKIVILVKQRRRFHQC